MADAKTANKIPWLRSGLATLQTESLGDDTSLSATEKRILIVRGCNRARATSPALEC